MARDDHLRPVTEEAWRQFLTAHAALTDRLDAELRAAVDLPLESYDVLYQLASAGGRRTMGELADALLIGASRCTRRVDRLTEAGLVERQRHAEDARIIDAVLTPQGRTAQRRAAAIHIRGIEQHFGRLLGDDEAMAMADVFRAAVESARLPGNTGDGPGRP
jgi:DNA-binding MarR family transcriptional regulator